MSQKTLMTEDEMWAALRKLSTAGREWLEVEGMPWQEFMVPGVTVASLMIKIGRLLEERDYLRRCLDQWKRTSSEDMGCHEPLEDDMETRDE